MCSSQAFCLGEMGTYTEKWVRLTQLPSLVGEARHTSLQDWQASSFEDLNQVDLCPTKFPDQFCTTILALQISKTVS